jgi:subtilisin
LRSFVRTIVIAMVAALATGVQSAAAEPSASNPSVPSFGPGRSLRATSQLQALISKAQAQGSVRVILALQTSYQPEGRLRSAPAVQAQRRAIANAQNALLGEMANRNVTAIRKFAFIPHLVVQADADALARLANSPNVASIAEDRLRRPSLMVSVPLIGAPNAWAAGFSGAGQVVAILDTGIDETHPFLAARVVSEACFSSTYPPDTAASLCPGGVPQSTDPGSGIYCDYNSIPICVHGTHVAGIAAGRDNGSIGFSGVAKNANIISIQVYSYFSNCGCIQAYDSDILSGLERVQTLSSIFSIAAANLSLGGGSYTTRAACDLDYSAYLDMIGNLRSLNIATVIASGNDYSSNSIEAPGCVTGAISVGATQDGSLGTAVDEVSSFSDSASFLSLLAPGQYIYSSIPAGVYQYQWKSGTSMATPHVTGAWAVLKSARPYATVDQILTALSVTGKPITDPRNGITTPRIRVDAAVLSIADPRLFYLPLISK